MSFFNRVADVAHKTVIVGLMSVTVFQLYQLGVNAYHGIDDSKRPHPQKEYIETLREKVDEEYQKKDKIDHRDWYDKDDNSYLDNTPKVPPPKKWEPPPGAKRYFN